MIIAKKTYKKPYPCFDDLDELKPELLKKPYKIEVLNEGKEEFKKDGIIEAFVTVKIRMKIKDNLGDK